MLSVLSIIHIRYNTAVQAYQDAMHPCSFQGHPDLGRYNALLSMSFFIMASLLKADV